MTYNSAPVLFSSEPPPCCHCQKLYFYTMYPVTNFNVFVFKL